jgi:hypothetical protein
LLNPVNLYFIYKTETSNKNTQSEMWVKGVRFINEGIVTSVNDMVTEVVMQFVAEDVKPFQYTEKESNEAFVEVKAAKPNSFWSDLSTESIVEKAKEAETGEVTLKNANEISDAEILKNLGTQISGSIPFYKKSTGK